MVTRIFRPALVAAATIEMSSASVVGYATLAARHVDRSAKAPTELVTIQSVFPDTHLTGSSGGVEIAVNTSSVNKQCKARNMGQNAAFWELYEGKELDDPMGFD